RRLDESDVGVPDIRLCTIVLVEVEHDDLGDSRHIVQQGMNVQRPELPGKVTLLFRQQRLIAEQQQFVLQQGGADRFNRALRLRLGKIDAADLGDEGSAERGYGQRHRLAL